MSAKQGLIIVGAVGNCLDIAEAANACSGGDAYEVTGYLDDDDGLQGTDIVGVPVLGKLADAKQHPDASFVFGIGSPSSFRNKRALIERLGLADERFATVVHPSSVVSKSARIGRGSVILSNCSVGYNAVIGDHVIVLQNSVIGHHSRIGDLTIMAAGVTLSGKVSIGTQCYIGVGTSMKEGVEVAAETLIGAGSVVVSDIEGCRVAYGVPAKAARH